MSRPGWARLAGMAALLACLMAAGVSSIRSGVADYRIGQETVASTEAAIVLTPQRAEYYARLAWLLSDSDPQGSKEALGHAVELNPQDAKSWIELGLRAEVRGDAVTSQQYLLRGAEVDKTFLPRWTLANYYFRHDDPARFWFWAKETAAMIYGDATPLFQLCGRVEEDGKLIERLEIRNPEARSAYLIYLLGKNRVDLIGPAAHGLVEANRPGDTPLLLQACNRLLESGRVGQAGEIWNGLADQGRVPFRTPDGKGEQLITNGSFEATPASLGFDWKLSAVQGISVSREEPQGLRLTLSGREPEDCELLTQLVPVRKKMAYHLTFQYRTSGIVSGAGLGWRITDARSGMVLSDGPSLASDKEDKGLVQFQTVSEDQLVRVALRYHRTPGTTRSEGFLILRDVELKLSPHSPIDGTRVR